MRGRRGGILGALKELRKGFWWIGEVATYGAWPPGRSQPSTVGTALATHSPPSFEIEILKTHLQVLYFNGAVDGNWAEPGNWAGLGLPTATDSVVATEDILSNSGSAPTVVNLTMEGADIDIAITVTGMATFSGDSENADTITGNATFNDSSTNEGAVTGTATFTGSAYNNGGTAGTFVPALPGQPTMIECCSDINSLVVFYPPSTGGAAILEYEVWVDNTPITDYVEGPIITGPVNDPNSPPNSLTITVEGEDFSGLDVSVRARNASGWGPLAADVVGQVC